MEVGCPGGQRGWRWVAVTLGLLTLAQAIALGPRDLPLLQDTRVYFHIAMQVADRGHWMDEVLDPKLGLANLANGAAIRLGGFLGIDAITMGRGYSALWLPLAVLACARLAWLLGGGWLGALVAGCALLSFWQYILEAMIGFQPKIPLLALMPACVIAWRARQPALAGVLSAICYLHWQPSALVGVVLVAVTLATDAAWRASLQRMLLGGLCVYLLHEAYFLFIGAWWQHCDQAYLLPARFMSNNFRGWSASLGSMATLWRQGGPGYLNMLPFAMVAWMVVAVCCTARRWKAGLPCAAEAPGLAAVWLLAFLSSAFTFYDHQGFPDFYLILPWLSVASGLAAACAVGRGSKAFRVAMHGIILCYVAFLLVLVPYRFVAPVALRDQHRIAAWLSAREADGYRALHFGSLHLSALQGLRNWKPPGFFFRGVEEYVRARSGQEAWSPELNGEWPELIVFERYWPARQEEWLSTRYYELHAPLAATDGLRLWVRQDLKPPSGTELRRTAAPSTPSETEAP